MTLTALRIAGYQSLHDIDLHLGQFTVVTGATGAGKSAVVRALRLAAFNARGTSYISLGLTRCQVALAGPDWTVELTRAGKSSDSYRIQLLVPSPAGPDAPAARVLTKLNGAVPEEVSSLLGLSDLNFAGQFDGPFLLRVPPAEAARTLGELTNVTLVFSAAREAARRRHAIGIHIKSRKSELERLRAEAQQFAGLRARLETVSRAEQSASTLDQQHKRSQALDALLWRLRSAQDQLRIVQQALPPLPEAGPLEGIVARYQRLRALTGQYRDAQIRFETASRLEVTARLAREHQQAQHLQVLRAAGYCPTCGQATSFGAAHTDGPTGH